MNEIVVHTGGISQYSHLRTSLSSLILRPPTVEQNCFLDSKFKKLKQIFLKSTKFKIPNSYRGPISPFLSPQRWDESGQLENSTPSGVTTSTTYFFSFQTLTFSTRPIRAARTETETKYFAKPSSSGANTEGG